MNSPKNEGPDAGAAAAAPGAPAADTGALIKDVLLYTGFRFVLAGVIFAVLYGIAWLIVEPVPWIPIALFAIVLALPLSMMVGKKLRTRINERAAAIDARRKARRADFRSRLEGSSE